MDDYLRLDLNIKKCYRQGKIFMGHIKTSGRQDV